MNTHSPLTRKEIPPHIDSARVVDFDDRPPLGGPH